MEKAEYQEILSRLKKISDRQRKVLSQECQSLIFKEIGIELHNPESAVKASIQEISIMLKQDVLDQEQ